MVIDLYLEDRLVKIFQENDHSGDSKLCHILYKAIPKRSSSSWLSIFTWKTFSRRYFKKMIVLMIPYFVTFFKRRFLWGGHPHGYRSLLGRFSREDIPRKWPFWWSQTLSHSLRDNFYDLLAGVRHSTSLKCELKSLISYNWPTSCYYITNVFYSVSSNFL